MKMLKNFIVDTCKQGWWRYNVRVGSNKRNTQTRDRAMSQKAHIGQNYKAQCGHRAGVHGTWAVTAEAFAKLPAKFQCSKCLAKLSTPSTAK